MFLNCENSWYLDGVPGFAGDTAGVLARIGDIAREIGAERVEFVGSSMGGFGALYYGMQFGADNIIVINPEARLGLPYSRSINDLRPNEWLAFNRANARLDNRSRRIQLFFSDLDVSDCISAAALAALPNVETVCYRGHEHHLAEFMARRGELQLLLFGDVAGGDAHLFSGVDGRDFVPTPGACRLLLRAMHYFARKRYAEAIAVLSRLEGRDRDLCITHYIAGASHLSLKSVDAAIAHLVAAWRVYPRSERFSTWLARAYLAKREPRKAVAVLSWLEEVKKREVGAAECYGKALHAIGDFKKAARTFGAVTDDNPDRWEAHLLQAECLEKTGETDAAAKHYRRAAELRPALAEKIEARIAGLSHPA